MFKNITIILFIVIWTIFSCKSPEKICFNNKAGWNYNLTHLVDTNQLYIKVRLEKVQKESNDLFLKNEQLFIKKYRPGVKFYSNGKFAYYNETTSADYEKHVIYGHYRVYNDTIIICRQYESPQSGKWYLGTSLIMNESGFFSGQPSNIITYYEKL